MRSLRETLTTMADQAESTQGTCSDERMQEYYRGKVSALREVVRLLDGGILVTTTTTLKDLLDGLIEAEGGRGHA